MKQHVRYQIRNTMRRSPLGITYRRITLHASHSHNIVSAAECAANRSYDLLWPKDNGLNHVLRIYEGCNFNSGNYLFTTDTK